MTSVIGIPRGTRLEQVVLVRGEVHVWIAARERHLPYEQWQGTFLRIEPTGRVTRVTKDDRRVNDYEELVIKEAE